MEKEMNGVQRKESREPMARRSAWVTVRLTQEERAQLGRAAAEAGLTLGALIRERLVSHTNSAVLLAEIRRIGLQQARLWLATAQDEEARAEIQRICSGVL